MYLEHNIAPAGVLVWCSCQLVWIPSEINFASHLCAFRYSVWVYFAHIAIRPSLGGSPFLGDVVGTLPMFCPALINTLIHSDPGTRFFLERNNPPDIIFILAVWKKKSKFRTFLRPHSRDTLYNFYKTSLAIFSENFISNRPFVYIFSSSTGWWFSQNSEECTFFFSSCKISLCFHAFVEIFFWKKKKS